MVLQRSCLQDNFTRCEGDGLKILSFFDDLITEHFDKIVEKFKRKST